MEHDPHSSLRDIFLQAAELSDPAAREAFLRKACLSDHALRARVDALLAADAASPPFTITSQNSLNHACSIPPRIPERIGRYRIMGVIGEGGYGSIYHAEQDEPVKRKVALKVIKLGMDTRQVVARFEAERQALALMEHPNIGRLLDAGATDSGQPFLVMEWVQGTKVTEFCSTHRLDLRQRIELFLDICQAVHHAHQKGIIHRDLKPSNILVSHPPGARSAVPKVIDFGIAKAMTGRLTDETLHTAFGQMMGTPGYMSPEQAAGGGTDIDTRTDIYSLGVLLYQLLTGKTPFDTHALLARGLDEMRRTIREMEPERPSTRVRRARGSKVAIRRSHAVLALDDDPEPPIPHLPEDLDWVVMKCLEKDRSRRYETVNGLEHDLRRWLNREPVTARPPTAAYRVRKWISRNQIIFTAACAVLLGLSGGLIASTVMFLREKSARKEVEVQRAAADLQRREFQQHAYASDMKLAQQKIENCDLEHALTILERHRPTDSGTEDLRGFEWRYLWQQCQGSPHDFLPGDLHMPWTLVASPDGRFVAAASNEGPLARVTVWDLDTREIVAQLDDDSELDGDIAGAVFSEDGRWLVTACHRLVKFYEVGTWREFSQLTLTNASGPIDLRGHTLVTTPVGHRKDPTQLSGLVIWNLQTRDSTLLANVTGPPTLSYDGRRLALRSEAGIEIRWLDQLNIAPLLLESSRGLLIHGSGFGSLKRALAFSPDGRWIAAPGLMNDRGDAPIAIWDASDGRRVDKNRLIGHAARIHALAWSTDSHRIATAAADGTVRIWDLHGQTEPIILTGHLSEPWCITFIPGQDTVVSSGISTWNDKVKVWHLEDSNADSVVPREWYPLWLSPDGSEVLSVSSFTHGIYRERFSGRVLHELKAPPGIPPESTASAGPYLLPTENIPATLVGFLDGRVASWFASSSEFPRLLKAHDGAVRAFASAAGGGTLITGGADRQIRWWNLETGQLVRSNVLDGPVAALAVSPDGRILMSASGETNSAGDWKFVLTEWDATSGRLLSTSRLPEFTFDLGFSPDGKWLAVCTRDGEENLHTHLLDLRSRTWQSRLTNVGRRLDFSPDGTHLLIWSTLWDLRTTPPLPKSLRGHRQRLMHQTFTPDSRTVVSTSDDGTVRLWSVATGQEMLSFTERGRTFSYPVVSADGTTLAAGSFTPDDRPLRFWHAPTLAEIDFRIRDGRINR